MKKSPVQQAAKKFDNPGQAQEVAVIVGKLSSDIISIDLEIQAMERRVEEFKSHRSKLEAEVKSHRPSIDRLIASLQ